MTIQQILQTIADTGTVRKAAKSLNLGAEEMSGRLRALASRMGPPISENQEFLGWKETVRDVLSVAVNDSMYEIKLAWLAPNSATSMSRLKYLADRLREIPHLHMYTIVLEHVLESGESVAFDVAPVNAGSPLKPASFEMAKVLAMEEPSLAFRRWEPFALDSGVAYEDRPIKFPSKWGQGTGMGNKNDSRVKAIVEARNKAELSHAHFGGLLADHERQSEDLIALDIEKYKTRKTSTPEGLARFSEKKEQVERERLKTELSLFESLISVTLELQQLGYPLY